MSGVEDGAAIAVAGIFTLPDGTNPSGQFGATLFSSDKGQCWSDGARFFESSGGRNIAAWEPRICEMEEGRLVVIFWAYDTTDRVHLPNHVAVSHDNGRTWSKPINTGHTGQAANILSLGEERLLTIHCHRQGESAIYVRLIDFTGDGWRVCGEQIIWGQSGNAGRAEDEPTVKMFKTLSFGQPSLLALGNGDVLATHWSIEDGQGKIRTHRLRLQG